MTIPAIDAVTKRPRHLQVNSDGALLVAGGTGGGGGGDASAAKQDQQTAVLVSIDGIYAEIVDQPNATTTYICQAPVGTAAGAAAWRVRRIVVSGTTTTTTWAGGGAFNQIAANRASLTYA